MSKEKIILGIDPGTTIMGFGLIKVVGKTMSFLQLNELDLKKYDDHYLKLKLIFERTIELIDTHNPDEIAIEAPFFGKNVQSMLKLGRAQGGAMATGLSREIPIKGYSPKKNNGINSDMYYRYFGFNAIFPRKNKTKYGYCIWRL